MVALPPLDLPPKLSATANALRRLIFEVVPGVEERIYKGRTSAGYHDRQLGAFCGLFASSRAVSLVFPRGVRLPKAERIVKKGGIVTFTAGARVPKATVKRIIHGALLARL